GGGPARSLRACRAGRGRYQPSARERRAGALLRSPVLVRAALLGLMGQRVAGCLQLGTRIVVERIAHAGAGQAGHRGLALLKRRVAAAAHAGGVDAAELTSLRGRRRKGDESQRGKRRRGGHHGVNRFHGFLLATYHYTVLLDILYDVYHTDERIKVLLFR